jgi:hypothetical protein
VECYQQTDRKEFWVIADPNSPELKLRLVEWQHDYKWDRPYGSLNGQAPIEMLYTKSEETPFWDEVEPKYDLSGKRFHFSYYQTDLALHRHTHARHQPGTK